MPGSKLLQLVRDGDLDGFEALCLEALEGNNPRLAEFVAPFEELERRSLAERAATLGQMILENTGSQSDPVAALKIARVALLGDPTSDELRDRAVTLYRQVHGDRPGLENLLQMSGLTTGRPARNAIRVLDVCLSLKRGDALIGRAEDVIVGVLEVDLEQGLVTLQHPRRPLTVTLLELASEYEPVACDDFRVLRALKPERLSEMLESDPVAVVIGLIHAHGEALSQDMLRRELVPRYIPTKQWSKWWTQARTELQRSPHVIVEGRAPVLLRYTAEAWTLEDATWQAFERQSDPIEWLASLEGYLRQTRTHKQEPDVQLLARCHTQLDRHRESVKDRRPSEALACALVSERIEEVIGGLGGDARTRAVEMLRRSGDPVGLIGGLESETLWGRALAALATARPEDAGAHAAALVPLAPAALLDRTIAMADQAHLRELVQAHVDTGLADPVNYPELIYWLWKGPKVDAELRLPADDEFFATIIETLSALGRTLNPGADLMRRFRRRTRTALALRDYARARECLARVAADRAITLRRQLERLEGLGDNTRNRLLRLLREAHPSVFVVQRARLKPWEDPNVLWNTAAGIRRRTGERDQLVNVTMKENSRRIGEAASHGDLSENSEYRFALEERDFLRARLAQMNHDLALAEAIEPHRVATDHVGVGSRVTLRDLTDGSTRVMTFLGPFDTNVDQGIFNYGAPFSQQLMGLRVGERKKLMLNDRECEFEVLEIGDGLSAERPAS